ncbi:periplasmic heavy metal sensor [Fulvivirga lutimaris]|uniref:periplasmic heavy metal sensor n=1 Tax=Fulvivirga lutimaris TaxID=1819566 RepID=UPI0012BC1218|nr:periplasmic heavy metal sensor [Fulvivirga lutimaris]MTI40072.1 periplasmic heavy metal sensor [Fulvivirga lutimaris]
MKNNKALIGVIIVLVILNGISLSFIWNENDHHDRHRPPKVERYLGKRLHLNEEQVTFFKKSRREHFERKGDLMAEIAGLRTQLAQQLEKEASDSLLNLIASNYKELEMLNHEHFRRLRSICDDEQKLAFDSLLFDLAKKGELRGRTH